MKFALGLLLAALLPGSLGVADAASLPLLPAIYVGRAPAAGGTGHLRIIVSPDGSFVESAPGYALSGTWIFDADGRIFAFTSGGKTSYFAVSAHGDLVALDRHAKRVVGDAITLVREEPDVPRTLASTTWSLVEMDGKPVVVAEGATVPSLVFDAHASRVSGSTGCNRLMGGYTRDGDALHFTPLATTRMLCTDSHVSEQAFLAALSSVTRYHIAGAMLTLADGDRAVLLLAPST